MSYSFYGYNHNKKEAKFFGLFTRCMLYKKGCNFLIVYVIFILSKSRYMYFHGKSVARARRKWMLVKGQAKARRRRATLD